MEAQLETLITKWMGDASGYLRMLDQAQSATDRAARGVESAASKIEGLTNKMGGFGQAAMGILGQLGATLSVTSFLGSAVQQAAEMEQMQLSFEVMLGSAERGQQMVRDLVTMAANTPMTMPGLVQATRTLLQFGVEGDNVIPILGRLGDIVGGDANKLQSMALAFGQMSASGRLMGQDLLQMVQVGFNPLKELEKMGRIQPGQGRHMMEAGQIGINDVIDAIQNATAEGGTFFNMMQRQSQTTSGLFSTLQDNIMATMRTIGSNIITDLHLNDVIRWLSDIAQAASDWLTNMDPNVRAVGAGILVVTAVVMGLSAAFSIAGAAFSAAFGGIPLVLGIIITATAGIIAWAASFQSVRTAASNAWTWIKEKTSAFITWATPIFNQYVAVAKAGWDLIVEGAVIAWDGIKYAAQAAWDFFVGIWDNLVGDSEISWEKVRGYALDGLIAVEFALKNLGPVANVVWLGLQLRAVEAANIVVWQFTEVIPAAIQWFRENFVAIVTEAYLWYQHATQVAGTWLYEVWNGIDWESMWAGFRDGVQTAFTHAVEVLRSIPSAAEAGGNIGAMFAEMWAAPAEDAVDQVEVALEALPDAINEAGSRIRPFVIPPRISGELETQLRTEFETAAAALDESFQAFRERRLRELLAPDSPAATVAANDANRTGLRLGDSMAQGAKKGIDKLDATIFGSAESLHRMTAYLESFNAMQNAGPGTTAPSAPAANAGGGWAGMLGGWENAANNMIHMPGTEPAAIGSGWAGMLGGWESAAASVQTSAGEEQTSVLEDIRELLRLMVNRGADLTVETLDLGEGVA